MSKKKLISLSLVVIMIAILSFSTLAWFTDSETVKNDFMIADSDDDTADEIFSVDVWEDKNGDGVADDEIPGDDEEGLTYKDVLPGDELAKKVHVKNTGYYDQYIRVTVTVSDYSAWKLVLNKGDEPFALQEIVKGLNAAELWYVCEGVIDQAVDTITYTLYYQRILVGDQANDNDSGINTSEAVVFESVKIPASMTQAQAVEFEQNFQITVKAEAAQTENILATKTYVHWQDAKATFDALDAE